VDRTPSQARGRNGLRVARDEVQRLVAPAHRLAVNVEHDALDGLLHAEHDGLTVRAGLDAQPERFPGREVDELERLRPVSLQ
jgi:hypothetical protein